MSRNQTSVELKTNNDVFLLYLCVDLIPVSFMLILSHSSWLLLICQTSEVKAVVGMVSGSNLTSVEILLVSSRGKQFILESVHLRLVLGGRAV